MGRQILLQERIAILLIFRSMIHVHKSANIVGMDNSMEDRHVILVSLTLMQQLMGLAAKLAAEHVVILLYRLLQGNSAKPLLMGAEIYFLPSARRLVSLPVETGNLILQ